MKKLFTYFLGIAMLCGIASNSLAQTDTIAPVVLDFQIEFTEAAANDSVDAVFTLVYSEAVELVDTFTIVTHYNSGGLWEEFDRYDTTEVVVENNVVTVTPERSFLPTGRYEFIVTSGSVADTSGNKAAAYTSTFLADEDAPEVIDLEIAFTEDQLTDSASAVFTLTYSEDIVLNENFIIATHFYDEGTWPEWDVYEGEEVTVQGNVLTITPERMFSNVDRYELIVAWGAVSDIAGNLATSFTRVFKPDATPPEVIDIETVFTETEFEDSLGVSFVLTYDEDVKLTESVNIVTHYRSATGWEEYEVISDTGIVVTGSTIALNPSRLYYAAGSYELVATGSSISDLADNRAGAYTNVFLMDTVPPKLIGVSPDLSALVPTNATFTLTFDEDVRLANNFGFYTYYRDEVSGEYVEIERLDASQATVENNVVTFNPDVSLMPESYSQIILTANSVLDMQGNAFINMMGGDTLTYLSERFWTAATGVTVVNFSPAHQDTLSSIPQELTILFGEALTFTDTTAIGSQSIDSLVYLRSNGTDLEYNASYNTTSNAISIVPVQELAWGSSYTYGFIDGFLNEAMDSIPAAEVTFVVVESTPEVEDFTIAEINGEEDASPEPGQVVRITGTITGIYNNEGFFVQDSIGSHSGIWVEYSTTAGHAVGDGVVVTGVVDTLQGVTAIVPEEVAAADAPVTIEPLVFEFNTDSLPMYRNVLIQIMNARATEADETGEWVIYAEGDADSVVVNSRMYTFAPVDSSYYNVTGIVTGWDSIYRVEPRMETDIMEVSSEFLAIAEVYGQDVTSPYLGEVVQIAGTVTAVYAGEGFFVQDENAEKGGIWVEYTGDMELQVNDGVSVAGTVTEQTGLTYIVAEDVSMIAAPIVVEPIVVNFESDSIPMYQGVLVQVENARASAAGENGEWMIYANNEMDSVTVSSRLYAYTPVADNVYDVTGVVTFRDSIYRIEPRMEADITFATNADLTPDVKYNVYPNPFGNYIKISNNDMLTRIIITNITGQRVADVAYPKAEINTSHLVNGVYVINMFRENNLVKSSRIIKR